MSKDTIQTVNYLDSDDAELYVLAKKETDNGLFKKELKIKAETLSLNDSEKINPKKVLSLYIQLRVDDMKKGNLDFFEEDLKRIKAEKEKSQQDKKDKEHINEWFKYRNKSSKKKSFIRRLFEWNH